MIKLNKNPVVLKNGLPQPAKAEDTLGRNKTMAYSILKDHSNSNEAEKLTIKFDSLISHDITNGKGQRS